jgi:hypothetical protein
MQGFEDMMKVLLGKGIIYIHLFNSISQKRVKMSSGDKKFKIYLIFAIENSGRSAAW